MSQAIETMNNGCEKDMLLLDYVRKQSPPPFLLKTYMLIEDPSTDNIISWNATGTAFVVWKTAEFSRDILPTLFKHSNFSSFVRQLNTYGFRKVTTSRWEFCNDMFRKGERDSLCNIRRRKAWETKFLQSAPIQSGQQEGDDDRGSSSTSSSSSYNSLLDENRRLKRENVVLSNELMCIKKKFNELLDLAMVYAKSEKMMEEEDERPKLFGVGLEVPGEKKRKRSTDIGEMIHVFSSHK